MTSPPELTTSITNEQLIGIVLSIPCDHCRARVGDHCKIRDGEALLEEEGLPFHIHRVTPVWMIFKLGYRLGRRDEKAKHTTQQENEP